MLNDFVEEARGGGSGGISIFFKLIEYESLELQDMNS